MIKVDLSRLAERADLTWRMEGLKNIGVVHLNSAFSASLDLSSAPHLLILIKFGQLILIIYIFHNFM